MSKVQLINTPAPTEPSPSNSSLAATNEASVLTDPPRDIQIQLEDDKDPQATPARDILEAVDTDIGEDTSSTTEGKKRKNTLPASKTAKKKVLRFPVSDKGIG